MVYSRSIDKETLEFGVSGKLLWNALLMYDRQTHSLWTHITGEAISGKLKGNVLKALPSTHTTWEEWKKTNPTTLLLSKDDGSGRRYDRDPYEDYYQDSSKIGLAPQKHRDRRIPPKDQVVGIKLGEEAKAFPFRYLGDFSIINDQLSETKIVVIYSKERKTAVVFDRTVNGQSLSFENGDKSGELYMRDKETGTLWLALTGEAVEGRLKGKSLRQIPSMMAFWFGWVDYFPETKVFQGGE